MTTEIKTLTFEKLRFRKSIREIRQALDNERNRLRKPRNAAEDRIRKALEALSADKKAVDETMEMVGDLISQRELPGPHQERSDEEILAEILKKIPSGDGSLSVIYREPTWRAPLEELWNITGRVAHLERVRRNLSEDGASVDLTYEELVVLGF